METKPDVPETKEYRNELWTYIENLKANSLSNKRNSGLTLFALCVAIAYVVWNSMSALYTHAPNDPNFSIIIIIYSVFYLLISSFLVFFYPFEILFNQETFERRIGLKEFSIPYAYAFSLFAFIIPGSALAYSSQVTEPPFLFQSPLFDECLGVGATLLFIFAVSLIIQTHNDHTEKEDFPDPTPASLIGTKAGSAVATFSYILFISIIFTLLFGLSKAFSKGDTNYFLSLHLGFNLCLLNFSYNMILALRNDASKEESLAQIERDIIIHQIPNSEIIKRLEKEHIGTYFGDWLKNKLQLIKNLSDIIISNSEELKTRLEYRSVDKNHLYANIDEINRVKKVLTTNYKIYIKHHNNLLEWIHHCENKMSTSTDADAINLLGNAAKDLQRTHENVSKKLQESKDTEYQITDQ